MDLIIDFYKNLDTVNLIVFWGIIVVLILLLIFSIILANKNRKLKVLLQDNLIDEEKKPNNDEIPVKLEIEKVEEKHHIKPPAQNESVMTNEEKELKEEIPEIVPTKKTDFIAEEYVMEYNKDLFSLPNIKKAEPYEDKKEYNQLESTKTGPYQRNVLRELSSNQTSPIGIIKKENDHNIEKTKATELYNTLTENEVAKEQINKREYIKNVSKKLAEAVGNDDINRTEYEIKQEEDAIISYDELMQKKDKIRTIDEEEAVISIDELIQKKESNDKMYNITADEANDKFIKELKHFRKDL